MKIRSGRRSFANLREEASPRASQERPRQPRSSQGGPKDVPRGSSWRPGGSQRSLRRLPKAPGETSEAILAFRRSTKSSFESHLWRDSLEKRVRSGFLTIFEACTPTRKCKKPIKTYGFPRFFVGRGFFEKVSAVEGKSMKKSLKTGVRGSKIGSKSSQDRPKSLFGALLERFFAKSVAKTKRRTPKSA